MQLFEKITTLEQERLSFVTKNEELNNQNKALWLAINEMVSNTCNVYTVEPLYKDIPL